MIKEYFKAQIFIYILECIVGLSICYALYKLFPQHQFYWSMISVLLVIAPDSKDSARLAVDRMKANILGSSIGLLLFLIHRPDLLLVCIAVALTIVIGTFLKLNAALRTSLAALVIVMIHEEQRNSAWSIALERMGCVTLGCVIGLLVILIFNSLPIVKRLRNKEDV